MKLRVKRTVSGDFSGAMTDISFLLIIFFLVTSVFMATEGILLRLPSLDSEPRRLKPDEVIQVDIVSPGSYLVEGEAVNTAELAPRLALRIPQLSEPVLILSVAEGVVYQEVLGVLETAKENGAAAFSVASHSGEPLGVKIEGEGE